MSKIICDYCGESGYKPPNKIKQSKKDFCSIECKKQYYKMKRLRHEKKVIQEILKDNHTIKDISKDIGDVRSNYVYLLMKDMVNKGRIRKDSTRTPHKYYLNNKKAK